MAKRMLVDRVNEIMDSVRERVEDRLSIVSDDPNEIQGLGIRAALRKTFQENKTYERNMDETRKTAKKEAENQTLHDTYSGTAKTVRSRLRLHY